MVARDLGEREMGRCSMGTVSVCKRNEVLETGYATVSMYVTQLNCTPKTMVKMVHFKLRFFGGDNWQLSKLFKGGEHPTQSKTAD